MLWLTSFLRALNASIVTSDFVLMAVPINLASIGKDYNRKFYTKWIEKLFDITYTDT